MDWTKFYSPEAFATYVVFFLSICLGIASFFITRFINRTRPKKVRLIKVAESSLVEVDPEVRDDIVVTYKQKPANSLYLTTFEVKNVGDSEIENIEMILNFHETEIIEVIKDDPIPKRESQIIKGQDNNQLVLTLPYINQENLYQDRVKIKVFALQPIKIKNVSGGGRGWKVEFLDRVQLTSEIAREISSSIPSGGSSIELAMGFSKAFVNVLPKLIKLRDI